jgi:hypothetical protein
MTIAPMTAHKKGAGLRRASFTFYKKVIPPGSVRSAGRRVNVLGELPLRKSPYVLGVFLRREVHVGQYETQYGQYDRNCKIHDLPFRSLQNEIIYGISAAKGAVCPEIRPRLEHGRGQLRTFAGAKIRSTAIIEFIIKYLNDCSLFLQDAFHKSLVEPPADSSAAECLRQQGLRT